MKAISRFLSPIRLAVVLVLVAAAFAIFSNLGTTEASQSEAPVVAHTISVVSTSAAPGTQVFVSIELESGGDEVAGSFTINFDPAKLSISDVSSPAANPDVTIGTGVPAGSALTVNGNQAASGRIGFLVDSSNLFAAGPGRQFVRLRFTVAPNAVGVVPLTFGNTPTPQSFSNGLGEPIEPFTYVDGSVNINTQSLPVTISGQVTRPNGVGLGGAQVIALDTQNNARFLATTSSFGFYTISDVPSNRTYSVAVSSRAYRFSPVSSLMVGSSNITELNFIGQE